MQYANSAIDLWSLTTGEYWVNTCILSVIFPFLDTSKYSCQCFNWKEKWDDLIPKSYSFLSANDL